MTAFVLMGTAVAAQSVQKVPVRGAVERLHIKQDKPEQPAVRKGSCLFSEDFEGGAIPAGWDIGAQVEQYTDDPNGTPLGTFVDAWVVGTAADANNGGFFEVPDDPAGNLFAYANDDGDPCNCGMTDIGLVTPSYDFSGQTGLGMTVRLFHDGQYATSTAFVQASTDGGVTWTDIYTVPEAVGVWQTVGISLAAYDNAPDVMFRFKWDDGGGWGTGMAVDDLCITTLVPNDLVVGNCWSVAQPGIYDDATVRNLEYRKLPLEQATELEVAVDVVNNGSAAQPNTVLNAEVFVDGVSQGTFTSPSGTTINPGTRDTLVLSTGWTPSVPGMVEVQITVQSDSTDANPGDNVATKTFDVTGPMMADEYNIMSNNDPGLTGSITIAQNATYSLIGTEFQIENSGSMAYGVGLVFRDNTELPAVVNVYLSDDNADVGEILAFEIQGWHLSGAGENNVINIPFDGGPVALDPTMDYTLLVEGPGTEQVRIGVGGTTNPGGLFGYDNGDATLYQFIGWGNPAVMTSLMLAEAPSSIEETNNGLTIMGNRPNPFNDVTTIVYELVEGRNVGFQVFDVTGKVVFEQNLGNRAAGQHQIQLDAERFAPGMYNYTITAGDARISRNMVVTR